MNTIFFDRKIEDYQRRKAIYEGQIFVYSATKSLQDFTAFTKELIQEAFGHYDPETAQHHLTVEQYVGILKKLKPQFIHHPESKRYLQKILLEMDCDPMQTYFDVPRLRTSTSDGYLTSGIAYAFHPHRDTWYSAPMSQINWWLPVYEAESDNVMAFHPEYFDKAIENSSGDYNYQKWVATSRKNAANHVKKDTRKQPVALEEIRQNPQNRIVTPAGGMMGFSASHLHSSVENTSGKTRFSIDFRAVHLEDLKLNRGAVNVDSYCTGTTLGDYLRVADLKNIPQSVINQYMYADPFVDSRRMKG